MDSGLGRGVQAHGLGCAFTRWLSGALAVIPDRLALPFTALVLSLAIDGAAAQTTVLQAFAACEASVLQNSDAPLKRIGSKIDETERQRRFRVDTADGTVVAAIFPSSDKPVRGCILWGRHPELATEFKTHWTDWVEWSEAEAQSRIWFRQAAAVEGSVDLTDHTQPGFVVARCDALRTGIVLTSQPSFTGMWRQVLPTVEPAAPPSMFFQFSVMQALSGRCAAAVEAHRTK